MKTFYKTKYGSAYQGDSLKVLANKKFLKKYEGRVQLILTSPPFPLVNKKKYGNLNGDNYIKWIGSYAPYFRSLLCENGSLVIEIGNTWDKGSATMSTVPTEALLELKKQGDFVLCQEFICNNPARLPGPAQWVTKNRVRVKDSYTRIWWLSKHDGPKADNNKVLLEYSDSMKKLIKRKRYNHGRRPSEHVIGEKTFLYKNKGSIPSNFINDNLLDRLLSEGGESALSISQTLSSNNEKVYQKFCSDNGLSIHPARMPEPLVRYFVQFLSDKEDLVLDPFGGSNTTGYVSQVLGRRWVSVELNEEYLLGSKSRFSE